MIKKLYELSDTKKIALSIILIAAAAVIIYSNTFHSSFHFDDTPAIVENYAIHRFDIKEIFSTSSRPILDITFALNYYFGKLDVFGYHLINIMLHIVNGILLYFILLFTINPPLPNPPPQGGRAEDGVTQGDMGFSHRMPLYASLIFIAHPVQTQAVTYIVSRSSVLAATFYLLALLLFIKAFKKKSGSSNPPLPPLEKGGEGGFEQRAKDSMPYALSSKLYLTGAFLSSCLGMGTKQETATLPLMLLIYDFYFISKGDWKALKGHYKVHLVMFSTLAVVLYLIFSGLQTYITFDYAKGVPMPQQVGPITSFQYFLTQLHVIPYYIKLLFIPTNLNLDYDWPLTRNIDLPTALFFILLTLIVILAIKLFHRARLASFGIIWFFVTLSVTSSFIVIFDVIFEHRLYLPSIGFAIVMAFMISRISDLKILGKG
ncbi:MAG: hypothetical protein Q8K51_03855 [Nitrospirota bacterium]|nr:hypothetical protein [Nitrospirota bacterium]